MLIIISQKRPYNNDAMNTVEKEKVIRVRINNNLIWSIHIKWERSGSVVEWLTRDRGTAGSSLTGVTALWSLSKTHLS